MQSFHLIISGTSLNPSLNFNTIDPTPHDSNWLSLEESYHIKPSVRKRRRNNEIKVVSNGKTKTPSPSTPKELKNSKQAQQPSLKTSTEFLSPVKKNPVKTNAEFLSSMMRSPGTVTPSPTSR